MDGLRRASANSFGFGGSNAHAVVEDAYPLLSLNGLTAHYCTVEIPPGFDMEGNQAHVTNGETVLSRIVDNDNSTSKRAISGHRGSPAKTNGIPHDKPYRNGSHATPTNNSPKILVWSAGDESGIGRLMDNRQKYSLIRAAASASEELSFVDKVSQI